MTREKLQSDGWVEIRPRVWQKGKKVAMDYTNTYGPASGQGEARHAGGDAHAATAECINPLAPLVVTKPARPAKRLRQSSKPLMNKLETEFNAILQTGKMFGLTVSNVRAQSIRFKLGNGIWFKPDFTCRVMETQFPMGIEVKGPHAFRGGFENLKVAASQYPEIKWLLVWKDKGQWTFQDIFP